MCRNTEDGFPGWSDASRSAWRTYKDAQDKADATCLACHDAVQPELARLRVVAIDALEACARAFVAWEQCRFEDGAGDSWVVRNGHDVFWAHQHAALNRIMA